MIATGKLELNMTKRDRKSIVCINLIKKKNLVLNYGLRITTKVAPTLAEVPTASSGAALPAKRIELFWKFGSLILLVCW